MAHAFAREGASVFLAGRAKAKRDKIADEIVATATGDAYIDAVVERAGAVDISFNLIGYGGVQEPLTEISGDEFIRLMTTATRGQFLTIRAAARHMMPRRSGVIPHVGGAGHPAPVAAKTSR